MLMHLGRVIGSVVREYLKPRSSEWPKVRRAHLEANPTCAACGKKKLIQVHHVDPFHLDPKKELDPGNLISLCMGKFECHVKIGHSGDFHGYNPLVRRHAKECLDNPDKREEIEERAK